MLITLYFAKTCPPSVPIETEGKRWPKIQWKIIQPKVVLWSLMDTIKQLSCGRILLSVHCIELMSHLRRLSFLSSVMDKGIYGEC